MGDIAKADESAVLIYSPGSKLHIRMFGGLFNHFKASSKCIDVEICNELLLKVSESLRSENE